MRFEVLILFPAIGLAVVGTGGVGIAHGDHVGAVMLTIAFTAAALQIGYLFGLVTRAVIASLGVQIAECCCIGRVTPLAAIGR